MEVECYGVGVYWTYALGWCVVDDFGNLTQMSTHNFLKSIYICQGRVLW